MAAAVGPNYSVRYFHVMVMGTSQAPKGCVVPVCSGQCLHTDGSYVWQFTRKPFLVS